MTASSDEFGMAVEMQAEQVRIGAPALFGSLVVPSQPRGLVVFAQGSGSGRASPRNLFVAAVLQDHGLATLLLDLLTDAEACDRCKVFDIDLLGHRAEGALQWLQSRPDLASLRVGLCGASTGAAAALWAAAMHPGQVGAVVSRGGRPDLATEYLALVDAPTLLIVGGADGDAVRLNRSALSQLRCDKRLEVVPGATHLFEEPGAPDTVAHLAGNWFVTHLAHKSLV